ncbi:MAG: Asp-tRNA(Asn)/Glu-tRNA(Gln) amidotransferase subunit GatB [Chloroflexi bacterium]|nr:Asp-tRNA(Asn)/Glu-tRNA(Gln) amidotransferase subunit GatB [Chloroflexota bacterium]
MHPEFEPVIGLEIHAVLETRSKMFCDCRLVASTHEQPNVAVCPVCSGMPGTLPVVNHAAVEYALRVALALECEIATTSIFARKSYFYPDLPKGYQISQYEQPLARNGRLKIDTSQGEQTIRIRRVHLEEDTGKLTHLNEDGETYSLVDLNRSGLPLLEIVSQPDMHSAKAVRAYAFGLRSILRYLGVNSGNLEKGFFRIEPNVSIRPVGSRTLGTRTEIKNLNSFRALERGVTYEIERQTELLLQGKDVVQETVGWDEAEQATVSQRSKEDADDYRYFPEPDLPPLVIEQDWVDEIRASLPELPHAKFKRFQAEYDLNAYDAGVLVADEAVADYFEAVVAADAPPKLAANWISGELFGLMRQQDVGIEQLNLPAEDLAGLIKLVDAEHINQNTAKEVLEEMLTSGESAAAIVKARGLQQISDPEQIAHWVQGVLLGNPNQVAEYLGGKQALSGWLFGQVMQAAEGKANPRLLRAELDRQLEELSEGR